MAGLDVLMLVGFALVFLTVFFWVQTLLAYWQVLFGRINGPTTEGHPEVLLSFTIFLTLIAALVVILNGKSGKRQGISGPLDPPDELLADGDEEGLLGISIF